MAWSSRRNGAILVIFIGRFALRIAVFATTASKILIIIALGWGTVLEGEITAIICGSFSLAV